jgi:predicted AAA+ superfamily ATPase
MSSGSCKRIRIHPEVFDRLYEDWSTLESFQRTRGVLKLMAKVIYRLWNDGNNDLLIMPGSLPLYDADTRNEAIYYLPQGWDPVLERDIDGERAETTALENRDTRLGAVQACRRAARTVFLGSAPTTPNQMVRGIETERVVLGCAQPGQQTGVFKDALRRLNDHLHYLNSANNRFWFDTRPNLRREMEERKRRFQDRDDVVPAIRERLERSCATSVFGGIHVFRMTGPYVWWCCPPMPRSRDRRNDSGAPRRTRSSNAGVINHVTSRTGSCSLPLMLTTSAV